MEVFFNFYCTGDMENKSVILLPNTTRYDMGSILCIARNGVPPTQSKLIKLHVNCDRKIKIKLTLT